MNQICMLFCEETIEPKRLVRIRARATIIRIDFEKDVRAKYWTAVSRSPGKRRQAHSTVSSNMISRVSSDVETRYRYSWVSKERPLGSPDCNGDSRLVREEQGPGRATGASLFFPSDPQKPEKAKESERDKSRMLKWKTERQRSGERVRARGTESNEYFVG